MTTDKQCWIDIEVKVQAYIIYLVYTEWASTTICYIKYIYKITFWKRELWLAKSCVSITVWKTWKGSRHYTPSHTPSWTVWRIYALIKKAIFTFYFSTGYFIKEIGNISPRVPVRYRNIRGSLGEPKIAWKHSPYRARVPTSISRFSQTSTRV